MEGAGEEEGGGEGLVCRRKEKHLIKNYIKKIQGKLTRNSGAGKKKINKESL